MRRLVASAARRADASSRSRSADAAKFQRRLEAPEVYRPSALLRAGKARPCQRTRERQSGSSGFTPLLATRYAGRISAQARVSARCGARGSAGRRSSGDRSRGSARLRVGRCSSACHCSSGSAGSRRASCSRDTGLPSCGYHSRAGVSSSATHRSHGADGPDLDGDGHARHADGTLVRRQAGNSRRRRPSGARGTCRVNGDDGDAPCHHRCDIERRGG